MKDSAIHLATRPLPKVTFDPATIEDEDDREEWHSLQANIRRLKRIAEAAIKVKKMEADADREVTILTLRWMHGMTLEDVSLRYGITRERVRQIESKAFRKIKLRNDSTRILELLAAADQAKLIERVI